MCCAIATTDMTRMMTMSTTLPLADVKARFSSLVDLVAREQERVVVTRHGKPAAVLMSPEDLESLEETLAVMSDPDLLASIRESDAAIARGEAGTPLADVIAELRSKR